jgi:protein SCO1/2
MINRAFYSLAILALARPVLAQSGAFLTGPLAANGETRPEILKDVGIDQKLGAQFPLDAVFTNEDGKPVALRSVMGKRPVVLTLVYFNCPMLCTMILNDLVESLRQMREMPGRDFDILTISFDPNDTPQIAREKKANYLAAYGHPEAAAGWHFFTGSPSAIAAVTSAVGFRYAWDPATRQFAHASGIIVLTPDGRISRYFYGIDYAPQDLRMAITEASGGKVGGLADEILLFCCQYNPSTGRYGLAVSRALKLFGLVLIAGVASVIFFAVRRRAMMLKTQTR